MLTRIQRWYWRQRLDAYSIWLAPLERADIQLPSSAVVAIETLFAPELPAQPGQDERRRWRRDAIASLRPEVERLRGLLGEGKTSDERRNNCDCDRAQWPGDGHISVSSEGNGALYPNCEREGSQTCGETSGAAETP